MPKKIMTTDEWVAKLNALGGELDELAASLHPSVWEEQLAELRAKYRKLARAETCDIVQARFDIT